MEASDSFPPMATPSSTLPSTRGAQLVQGARQANYGHPLDNHERIAAFWTVRLRDKLVPGQVIEPHEAAAMMRLVKEARLMETVGHEDSLVDIVGYVDCEAMIHEEQARRSAQDDVNDDASEWPSRSRPLSAVDPVVPCVHGLDC